jgi:hypothetical protein
MVGHSGFHVSSYVSGGWKVGGPDDSSKIRRLRPRPRPEAHSRAPRFRQTRDTPPHEPRWSDPSISRARDNL